MEYVVELRKSFMVSNNDYSEIFKDGKCNAKYAEYLEAVYLVREMEINRLRKVVAEKSTANNKQSEPCYHGNREAITDITNYTFQCLDCGMVG